MPAWEKFLKEEEMWEAILFLYDFTGQKPRARGGRAPMTSRLISTFALRATAGKSLGCVAVLIVVLGATRTGWVHAQGPDVGTEAQRESGKQLYLKYCSQCHGEKGDGEGYATPHLRPRPRDFTSGKFKIRTTPNGALPTHQDLVNIIRRGMPYTSMPAWPTLSDQQVSELAYFITTFSADFSNPENGPQARSAARRAKLHERVDRAREEALRGHWLRQVPRHARVAAMGLPRQP